MLSILSNRNVRHNILNSAITTGNQLTLQLSTFQSLVLLSAGFASLPWPNRAPLSTN